MVPSSDQWIMFPRSDFVVFLVDLLEMYCMGPDWNKREEEQLALDGEVFAPTLRECVPHWRDPDKGPSDMK
jgi:hypothetical protein